MSSFLFRLFVWSVARDAKRRWGGSRREAAKFNTANFYAAFRSASGISLRDTDVVYVISRAGYASMAGGCHWQTRRMKGGE